MPTARGYELRLPGDWPPESVVVNGAPVKESGSNARSGWHYEGNTLTTIISIPRTGVASTVTIHVRRSPELLARRNELDGFSGAMIRLRDSYDSLNGTWPLGWSPDEVIDALQSGDRLTYHPELAGKELAHYRDVLPKAVKRVQEMTKGLSDEQMNAIIARVGQDWKSDAAKRKIAEYNERVGRAAAEIMDISSAGAQGSGASAASTSNK